MPRDRLKRKTKKPKGEKESTNEEVLPSKRPKLEASVTTGSPSLKPPSARFAFIETKSKVKKARRRAHKKADVLVPRVPSPALVSSKPSSPSDVPVQNSRSARTSVSSSKFTSPLITKKGRDGKKNLVAGATRLQAARERASEHWIENAGTDRPRGLTKSFVGNDEQKEILKFHATNNLGLRDWPEISLGQSGPMPRWRLREVEEDPKDGRDLHKDLIRTHRKRTHIRNVDQDDHPRSGDSSVGLGTLCWIFEPGPSTLWKGLTQEQLYEFAYLCLLDALNDFRSRDFIRATIKRAKLKSIRNVEDPLPPPPPPPRVTYFGPRAGVAEWPKIPPQIKGDLDHYYGIRSARPSLAVREGSNIPSQPRTYYDVDMMRHHMKGTLRGPGEISDTFDPVAFPVPQSVSEGGHGLRKSSLSKEWDPEKDAREDNNRNPRLGEYKILYFIVILIILSMFLCLFLYAFRIVR
ncbi:uncharacterized protein N7483_000331 [Penicillium malachiteum]|uniref:uncharacterized protein n=1 Tax=Penicillium malachiteum TaxID=1324776 RepID=UPI0025486826|nr:uncharacterized protein N7483_000331 [Penicillium malachiteum]KAJ5735206.1 hypothetical protein N7483_000331 [Penicillium malachiteum]